MRVCGCVRLMKQSKGRKINESNQGITITLTDTHTKKEMKVFLNKITMHKLEFQGLQKVSKIFHYSWTNHINYIKEL